MLEAIYIDMGMRGKTVSYSLMSDVSFVDAMGIFSKESTRYTYRYKIFTGSNLTSFLGV